jgi:hypothetical protein
MGMRFWIATENEPKFNYQVQWMRLNEQSDDGFWFFQDEWEDMGLHMCLGYNSGDPISKAELINEYENNPKNLLRRMMYVTDGMIEAHFNRSWIRPTPYWDNYRSQTIYYMKVKQMYLTALFTAKILCIIPENRELPKEYPQWYYYKETDVPETMVFDKICGKLSKAG